MSDVTPFMKRAYAYFTSQGYSPLAAATMAGHGQWESSGSSTIQDPRGEGSLGLYQWRLDRRTGLTDFAKARGLDPLNETTQLAFADWELSNTERAAGDQLRSASNMTEANEALMNFLRPAGWTRSNPQAGHAWSNRLNLSTAAATNLSDGKFELGPTPVQSPPQTDQAAYQVATASPVPALTLGFEQDPNTQSVWDILQRDGRKLAAMDHVPQQMEAAPSAPPPPPTMNRPTPNSARATLVDLVFGPRKRSMNV